MTASARGMLGLAAIAALVACGRDRTPAADTGGGGGGSLRGDRAATGAKPACPATGHWAPCAVLKRLESAGVAPQAASSLPDLPSLGAAPALYRVGRSGLAVYLFADSLARSRAARTLDSARYVSAATALTMRGETTAIQNDNLLALLFSRSEQQRERVSDALTAGPPQREKP